MPIPQRGLPLSALAERSSFLSLEPSSSSVTGTFTLLPSRRTSSATLVPGTLRADFGLKLSGADDFLAVESDDDVADFEAGARARRVRLYFADDCAVGVLQVEELRVLGRDIGDAYPNVGVADFAVTHQRVNRRLHNLGRE